MQCTLCTCKMHQFSSSHLHEVYKAVIIVIVLLVILRGFPGGSEDKASACNAGDLGSIPGLGRSPGEGNGNPLQYSCLENPMDRGAWQATVHISHLLFSVSFVNSLPLCCPVCLINIHICKKSVQQNIYSINSKL